MKIQSFWLCDWTYEYQSWILKVLFGPKYYGKTIKLTVSFKKMWCSPKKLSKSWSKILVKSKNLSFCLGLWTKDHRPLILKVAFGPNLYGKGIRLTISYKKMWCSPKKLTKIETGTELKIENPKFLAMWLDLWIQTMDLKSFILTQILWENH